MKKINIMDKKTEKVMETLKNGLKGPEVKEGVKLFDIVKKLTEKRESAEKKAD